MIKIIKIALLILLLAAIVFSIALTSIKMYVNATIKDRYANKVSYWKETNKLLPSGSIVFLGDSLTEEFILNEYFHEKYVLNRGIYGDTTTGVLGRMEESVYTLLPSKVFILIGTNDLDKTNDKPEIIAERIKKIVENIRKNTPNTIIYLQSVYPVNKTNNKKIKKIDIGKRNNINILKINKALKILCDNEKIIYVDTYSHLIDKNGNLSLEYTIEGLHLNPTGYKKVASILKPYLEN